MGRGKLNLRLIEKEKARYNTFLKRKNGLLKKAHEFKILCDVDVCVIIYGPKNPNTSTEPSVETWPADDSTVQRIVRSYTDTSHRGNNNDETTNRRTTNLSNFFQERKKKMDSRLAKLRRKAGALMFPEWDPRIEEFDSEHLREVSTLLHAKIFENQCNMEELRRGKMEWYGRNEFAVPALVPQIDYMPAAQMRRTYNDCAPNRVTDLQIYDLYQMSFMDMYDENLGISLNELGEDDGMGAPQPPFYSPPDQNTNLNSYGLCVDGEYDSTMFAFSNDIVPFNDEFSGNVYGGCGGEGFVGEMGPQFFSEQQFINQCHMDIVAGGDQLCS